jgi:fatty acid desaturase
MHAPEPPRFHDPLAADATGPKEWEWPTLGLLIGTGALWGLAMMLPAGWLWLQVGLLVFALTLHSSLSHEILHGHPFRSRRAGTVLGLIQPGLFVPYLRFRALHLAHHRDARLTDPYDDPETQYLDPAVWAQLQRWQQKVLLWNNTLLGRMVVGPFIGMWAFVRDDLRAIRGGARDVAWHWALHVPGVLATLWAVTASGMPVWAYLLACYGALSVLRIRTFLEHRAHERSSARSVIIEDRSILALLFLNNNFHAVHHMHPDVAWYRLPALYRARRARFLAVNGGYVYRSYVQIFRQYFLRGKEPVAHPLWRRSGD